MLMRWLLVVALFLFSGFESQAKTMTYVVGLSKPPYVLQSENNGYELELIREVTRLMGFEAKFLYVPFGRTPAMLDVENIDGILTVNDRVIAKTQHLTLPYITYQNVIVTKKAEQLTVGSVEDLDKLSVASFQNSSNLLGEQYASAVKRAPYYTEVPDQSRQVSLLKSDRVQALVIDINIFTYFATKSGYYNTEDYDVHSVFDPTDYSLAFKNIKHVALFNQAWAEYLKSGHQQALQQKYKLSRLTVKDQN